MTIRSPVSLRVSTTTSLYPGVPNICRSPADRRTVCSCHPVGHVPELGISLSIKGLGVIQICHQPLRVAFVLAAGEGKLPQGRIAEKLGCDHSNQNDHSPNQDGWKLACIVSAIGKHDVLLEALNVDSLESWSTQESIFGKTKGEGGGKDNYLSIQISYLGSSTGRALPGFKHTVA